MTEYFIVDDAATLIDIRTGDNYELAAELVDVLNKQEERIRKLENLLEIDNRQKKNLIDSLTNKGYSILEILEILKRRDDLNDD